MPNGDDNLPKGPIGSYELCDVLGRGASGVTFRGRHTTLQREVAVKLLNPTLGDSGNSTERFKREARILGTLDHPNILAIHDCGEHEGQLYMILELVEGETVRDLLERVETLPIDIAARIVRETLEGLACAHAQGIVHRDIKPDNLLLTSEATVKIADFGVGRLPDHAPITQVGAVVGTPYYMAPEQCAIPGWTTEIDQRSDLYAVGALFYELLTGRLAFKSRTLIELAQKKISQPPPDPRRVRPDVPAEYARVIRRLLAARVGDRYETAEAVLEALGAVHEEPTVPRIEVLETQRFSTAGLRKPASATVPPAPGPSPARRTGTGGHVVSLVGSSATYDVAMEPGKIMTLGRSSQRADVAIPDERMSRLHCQLRSTASGELWIKDRGSSNGTYVNDRRIPSETLLSSGDRLQVGDTELEVQFDFSPPGGSEAAGLSCSQCGAAVRPGSIIEGRAVVLHDKALVVCARCALNAPVEDRLRTEGFDIEELLDAEGSTLLYRARRASIDEVVALRVLDLDGRDESGFAERFRRDARALARLRHPCSLLVYDVRRGSSLIYVVHELVVGEQLQERVSRTGKLKPLEALQIFFSVGRVLELAESQGLHHMNLSPRSVLVTADGETKVTSFALGGAAAGESLLGERIRYVAPERLRPNVKIDPSRCDVYSLGAALLYALTGRPPHADLRDEGYLKKVRRRMLTTAEVDLGDDERLRKVSDFLVRCLEVDPAARFASVGELVKALEESVRSEFVPGFAGSAESLFAYLTAEIAGTGTSHLAPHKRAKGVVGGSFEGDELVEFLQMVGLNQRTGSLEVLWSGGGGRVFLSSGRLVGGECGGLTGMPAVKAALRSREGSFEFHPRLPEDGKQFSPVPVASFLLDVMREQDEQGT